MSLTLEELKDRLCRIEETLLLEILDIDSEQLVEKFEDRIVEKFDELEEEFAEDEPDYDY